MHNVPIDILVSSFFILISLKILSVFFTNLDDAAKKINSHKTWVAKDGTVYDEFAVHELEESWVLQHDYEEIHAESVQAAQMNLHPQG